MAKEKALDVAALLKQASGFADQAREGIDSLVAQRAELDQQIRSIQ